MGMDKLRTDPALRPDGRPYAESIKVPVQCVLPDDVAPTVGNVMRVEVRVNAELATNPWPVVDVVLHGRLVSKTFPFGEEVTIIRRNWK